MNVTKSNDQSQPLLPPPAAQMASYPHEFINCPGIPHRGIVCNNRIPPVLICSGRNEPYHRDLRFNACDECGHFKWLDPDLWAAAEHRKAQGPAYGAPPDLPPDNPPGPSFTLDPTLAYPPSQCLPPPPSQLPALPPSQLYPPPPPPSQPRIPSSSAPLMYVFVVYLYGFVYDVR
ncbi:hypothetical protein R3P38DRAFT_3359765 [Favolaschia claudopus]|uniref:Zinc finger GRF-type domain-containing protein n=1 Tax=Favolaschia claudopus TaxID=2862362 RepID=A0AAW0B0L8_9AGAR